MDIIAFCLPVLGILSYRIPPQNWQICHKKVPLGGEYVGSQATLTSMFRWWFFSPTWDPQAGSQGAAASSFRWCRCRWHLWWGRFGALEGLDIERKDALQKVCQIEMCAPCMIEEVMWNCWNCPDSSYIRSFSFIYNIILYIYIYPYTYLWYYDTPDFPALGTWGKHLKALPIPFAPRIVTFTVSYKISGC